MAQRLWGMDAASARRYLTRELGFTKADVTRMAKGDIKPSDKALAVNKQIDLVNVYGEMATSKHA